jgi:hypothetical protein
MTQPKTANQQQPNIPDRLAALLYRGLALLIWEAVFTPSTGITAVIRMLRGVLPGEGVLIAPWHARMSRAKEAWKRGEVVPTGFSYTITIAGRDHAVRVLIADQSGQAPILYLDIDGRFTGTSPYNGDVKTDSLFYAYAVRGLLDAAGTSGALAVIGADWQTTAALHLVHPHHVTGAWLHNVYDGFLADAVRGIGCPVEFSPFLWETALSYGTRLVDSLMCVNRGFSCSLCVEPIYTRVLAPHLQGSLCRAVGVDNANFTPLRPQFVELEGLLSRDVRAGLQRLEELKRAARDELPANLCRVIEGRVVFGAQGRRATQKLCGALVAAAGQFLGRQEKAPVAFVFATTDGDDEGSRVQLQQIRDLAGKYPDHVYYTDGRIDYFDAMLNSWHYNVMTSLWEPHGGCFSCLPVPLARAIDGLAAQICAYAPADLVTARLNRRFHGPLEDPNGLLFREPAALDPEAEERDLRWLVEGMPPVGNATFDGIVAALVATLDKAVSIWGNPGEYAKLVAGVLRRQMGQSWSVPLGGMITLMEEARRRRSA